VLSVARSGGRVTGRSRRGSRCEADGSLRRQAKRPARGRLVREVDAAVRPRRVAHRLGGRSTGRARGDAYRSGVPATNRTLEGGRTQVPQAGANRRRPWRPRRPGGANAWNGTWSCWPGGEVRTPWGPPQARPIPVAEVSSPVPAADDTAMIENAISLVQRSLGWCRLRGRAPSPWPSRRLPAGGYGPGGDDRERYLQVQALVDECFCM
jgi:hypothetical protein